MGAEGRKGCHLPCSLALLIPLSQGLSVTLELGWQPGPVRLLSLGLEVGAGVMPLFVFWFFFNVGIGIHIQALDSTVNALIQ